MVVKFVVEKTLVDRFNPVQRVGARVARVSLERGVITQALPTANTIAFSPSLIVTESKIDVMVEVTRQLLDEVAVSPA